MNPVAFDEQNFVFKKPAEMTEEQCGDLPVYRGRYADIPCIVSCWELSEDELEEVKKTGRVWLNVISTQMPPVVLLGKTPFLKSSESDV